jgi:signal transduction histidine kinase
MQQSSEKKVEADAKERIEDLETQLATLAKEFRDYKQKQAEDESRRLRTALIWAGGVILALSGFMWSEIVWPALKAVKP